MGLPMYRVSDKVRSTHGPDGAILLDVEHGRVLSLNATGSLIFERLQQGKPESQIVDELSDEFRVPHEMAIRDVSEFLHVLEQQRLVENRPSEASE
jgi:coenzyme PQQ synthesis protein D (PqqD)